MGATFFRWIIARVLHLKGEQQAGESLFFAEAMHFARDQFIGVFPHQCGETRAQEPVVVRQPAYRAGRAPGGLGAIHIF